MSEAPSSVLSGGSRQPIRTSSVTDHAVGITEYFGPRELTGTPSYSFKTRETSLQPTLGAVGLFEIGGVGTRQSASTMCVSRWNFNGSVKRAKDGRGFRSLEWELKEDELGCNPRGNQPFHTAFAFEHSDRPVLMRVEVEGRLNSRLRHSKQKLLRFCTKSADKDNAMVTLIDLSSASTTARKRLDRIAVDLNLAMQRENYEETPIELPGPTQATFGELSRPSEAEEQQNETLASIELAEMEKNIKDLARILEEPDTHEATFENFQSGTSGHSIRSDTTLLSEDINRRTPEETLTSKQLPWSVRDVVALVLVRWLLAFLKVMGTDQPLDLSTLSISSQTSDKKPQGQSKWLEEEEKKGSPLRPEPRTKLQTSPATSSLADRSPLSKHLLSEGEARRPDLERMLRKYPEDARVPF